MLHRLPGRDTGEIQPQDTELAAAPRDDTGDDQRTNLSGVRQSLPLRLGSEGRQHDDTRLPYTEPRSVTAAVLRDRAFQVRDILSTFSRRDFPAEHIKASIFDRIAFLEAPKPITDCVEQEDLLSTIFLLAVNNSTQYSIFRHVFSEDLCAQYFQQKLKRRIEEQIQAFDLLDTMPPNSADLRRQQHIETQVGMIAAELNYIVAIVKDDRRHRRQGERDTATHFVSMMQAVCRRNYSPGGGRPSGGSPHSLDGSRNSNLFQLLIGNATTSRAARFGLDTLAVFSKQAITEQREALTMVRRLLVEQGAPQHYVELFDDVIGD